MRFLGRPRILLFALGLLLPGGAPHAVAAQSVAHLRASGDVRATSVAGARKVLFGGRIWFAVGDRFRFGGGAWALPRPTRSGTLAQSGLEMDFGYGGASVDWRPLPTRAIALRALFGAGSGTVLDRVTGSRVDSEGFLVWEPEVALDLSLTSWLGIEGSAGYRRIFRADDLTRVDPADLSSWFLGFGLRLGPF